MLCIDIAAAGWSCPAHCPHVTKSTTQHNYLTIEWYDDKVIRYPPPPPPQTGKRHKAADDVVFESEWSRVGNHHRGAAKSTFYRNSQCRYIKTFLTWPLLQLKPTWEDSTGRRAWDVVKATMIVSYKYIELLYQFIFSWVAFKIFDSSVTFN